MKYSPLYLKKFELQLEGKIGEWRKTILMSFVLCHLRKEDR